MNRYAAQHLNLIADRIEANPWTWTQSQSMRTVRGHTGRDGDYATAYCSTGWLEYSQLRPGEDYRGVALAAMYQAIEGEHSYINCESQRSVVQQWNDDSERTVEEVVRAFRRAAELLDPPLFVPLCLSKSGLVLT